MKDFWTRRRDTTTDIIADRIAIRYREIVETAIRQLISEELEDVKPTTPADLSVYADSEFVGGIGQTGD